MLYKQLKEFVMDDLLKVQFEEVVYEVVWQWILYDMNERKVYVVDIMQYVRFFFMNF